MVKLKWIEDGKHIGFSYQIKKGNDKFLYVRIHTVNTRFGIRVVRRIYLVTRKTLNQQQENGNLSMCETLEKKEVITEWFTLDTFKKILEAEEALFSKIMNKNNVNIRDRILTELSSIMLRLMFIKNELIKYDNGKLKVESKSE